MRFTMTKDYNSTIYNQISYMKNEKNLKLIDIPTIKLHNVAINSYLIRCSVDCKLSEINES